MNKDQGNSNSVNISSTHTAGSINTRSTIFQMHWNIWKTIQDHITVIDASLVAMDKKSRWNHIFSVLTPEGFFFSAIPCLIQGLRGGDVMWTGAGVILLLFCFVVFKIYPEKEKIKIQIEKIRSATESLKGQVNIVYSSLDD